MAKEMLTVRVDPRWVDRLDAVLARYKAYLRKSGDERRVTRSEMVRDILEFGMEVIERKG